MVVSWPKKRFLWLPESPDLVQMYNRVPLIVAQEANFDNETHLESLKEFPFPMFELMHPSLNTECFAS